MSSFEQIIPKGQYVVAVEDSPVQRKKLKYFFNEHEIPAKFFSNAEDALSAVHDFPPVLIVSDVIMEGMDGFQFCAKIKANKTFEEIPVILLTSLSDPLDIIKGLQAGADNFITKPYQEEYLISRIKYLLEGKLVPKSQGDDQTLRIKGENYVIRSDKKQILDMLLSLYEAVILRNDELIKAQQQLYTLNQSLLSANQELEAFARTVSHDLRSPLSGVIGFTQILIENNQEIISEESMNCLHWIMESANKMNTLINDLLQFSLSGLSVIEPVSVNLSQIATGIMEDFQKRNPERKAEIAIQDNLQVMADSRLMGIVLTNLLGNAWKYTGKNKNTIIRFFSRMESGERIFCVEDNGCGFDMNKADQLFTPFVRLHTEQEFKGTGVGLNTVKKIIEKHGGRIFAVSEPEQGSRFCFTIGPCKPLNS